MAIVYGRVPKPAWIDRIIPDASNRAWDNLGPRQLKGVVYHRQVGTNWGTDSWFRTLWYYENGIQKAGGGQLGLTDFGIDNQTGEILQWNDYTGAARAGVSPNRSGWASGPWENPPGDGRAFVAKYGTSAINRDLVSLEIAGQYSDAISDAGLRSIVHLSAYLADQASVPYTNYPVNPHTGLVFTYFHSEFQNHKPCPGAVVIALIGRIIADTKTLLKQYQETDQTATELFLPEGTIQTPRPWNDVPFNIPWSNVTRWTPQIDMALERYPQVRATLGEDVYRFYWGLMAIESDGHQTWPAGHPKAGQVVEGGDSYGGGTAKGLMQIKNELHQWLDPEADWRTPEGNIRLGTAFINYNLPKVNNSWERLIAEKYHPGTSPNGTNPQSYVNAMRALIAEAKAAERPGEPVEEPVDPPPPPAFSREALAFFFGEVIGTDSKLYIFDPNAPVSKLWAARGQELNRYPALIRALVRSDQEKYFQFSDGLIVRWTKADGAVVYGSEKG